MKRMFFLILVFLFVLNASVVMAESNVNVYDKMLHSVATWERIDYNIVYSNSAKSVLPTLFNYLGTSLSSYSCRVFGDETGEVWLIYNTEVYRMWWSSEGYLVLTSTSDGLGYSGYGVFIPKK